MSAIARGQHDVFRMKEWHFMYTRAQLDQRIEYPKTSGDENLLQHIGLQPFPPQFVGGINASAALRLGNKYRTRCSSHRNSETFDDLSSRYHHLLSVVAYRVLGNHVQAEEAVQNCLRAVSSNAPTFECEGAFRSWMVRLLIDEAVTILTKHQSFAKES
jgi:hypothetical protein